MPAFTTTKSQKKHIRVIGNKRQKQMLALLTRKYRKKRTALWKS